MLLGRRLQHQPTTFPYSWYSSPKLSEHVTAVLQEDREIERRMLTELADGVQLIAHHHGVNDCSMEPNVLEPCSILAAPDAHDAISVSGDERVRWPLGKKCHLACGHVVEGAHDLSVGPSTKLDVSVAVAQCYE